MPFDESSVAGGLLPTPHARYSLVGEVWSRDPAAKKPTLVFEEPKVPQRNCSVSAISPLTLHSSRPVISMESETVRFPGREFFLTTKTRIGDETVTSKMKNTFLEYQLGQDENKTFKRSVSWSGGDCMEEGHCSPPSVYRTQPPPPPAITTYMIRNIPTRFTSMSFVRLLDDYGFGKTFDFFYLPMDFRSGKNMGYAFINFKSPNTGTRFVDKFNLKRLPVSTSRKIVEVYPSRRQGLLENVSLFRTSDLLSSSVSLPYYKPLVAVEDGSLVPLSDVNFLAN